MLFKFEVFNFFTQALDVNRSFIFRTLDEVPKGRESEFFWEEGKDFTMH